MENLDGVVGRRFLVSACLLGVNCRYDGRVKSNEKVLELAKRNVMVSVCPEMFAGLGLPRGPFEIVEARVVNEQGGDFTDDFELGANRSFSVFEKMDFDGVILKAKSPSCGYGRIYDGSFSGELVGGYGVFAKKFLDRDVKVFTEEDL